MSLLLSMLSSSSSLSSARIENLLVDMGVVALARSSLSWGGSLSETLKVWHPPVIECIVIIEGFFFLFDKV